MTIIRVTQKMDREPQRGSPLVPQLEQILAPQPRLRIGRAGRPDPDGRCVLYWMQRAQRGVDNPALNMAIELGNALNLPVLAVFGLTADYPGAQKRHYQFLLEGLCDAEADLHRRGVELVVRLGKPDDVVAAIVSEVLPAAVVGDENPVRIGGQWRSSVARRLDVPLYLVDADVVVPTSLFPREEYAARTIRPKIHKAWDEYLKPLTAPTAHVKWPGTRPAGEVVEIRVAGTKTPGPGSGNGRRLQGGCEGSHATAASVREGTTATVRDRAKPADSLLHK